MLLLRKFILAFTVVVVCCLPQTVAGHHRKHRNNGIDALLTAGVLAKVLQKDGGGHHHSHPIFIPIPYPVHHGHHGHHEDHHHHHGTHAAPQYQQLRHPGLMAPMVGPPLVGYQPIPMNQPAQSVQQSPFQGTDEIKIIVVS
ncbi:hypothetical protein CEXT_345431 [Caerostris extrusa]|uniref:Uncharacterized protein n=1 Tax=Caerostris extrusa TaxID=172846 RepID=A0AAV4R2Z3_CAEEX|nr:hypothetical protein CEXT_345431 [Caerostris extrusa]